MFVCICTGVCVCMHACIICLCVCTHTFKIKMAVSYLILTQPLHAMRFSIGRKAFSFELTFGLKFHP